MLDAIRRRTSVRTYAPRPLDPALRAEVQQVLAAAGAGVFGGAPRFALIDREAAQRAEKVRLGTYGFIQGHPHFVAGAIARGPHAEVDYGYVFEGVILRLTALGLGTCWLGGTFSRGEFARVLGLRPDETIPAVSPLGHAAPSRGLVERAVRFGAGADDRLPFERLFFDGHGASPLTRSGAGPLADVLEAVRRGPSASNRQPWRVVRTPGALHVFLARTPGYYGRLLPGVDLQAIDAGIALRHLEEGALAGGLSGIWRRDAVPPPVPAGWLPVAVWSFTG